LGVVTGAAAWTTGALPRNPNCEQRIPKTATNTTAITSTTGKRVRDQFIGVLLIESGLKFTFAW
jgi:hypothetical protein